MKNKIIHCKKDKNYNISVNYDQLLGDWSYLLKDYLNSEYHTNLMFELHNLYKVNPNPFFPKKDIFKAYQLCQRKDVRVVIINCTPMFNRRSNGLAFGNKLVLGKDDYDDTLLRLFNDIEEYQDNGCKVDCDFTLESWAKKGVLLLNYGLINIKSELFYNLIKTTINKLNEQGGQIFCLINNPYNMFKNDINTVTNSLIESTTLNYKVLENINILLEKSNGKNCTIKW